MIYGMQRFFAFKFHHDSAVYHEVGSKPTFQLYSAVNQGNCFLLFDAKAHFSQFECETGFLCRLPKTRSQSSMDSNGSSNDLFRQLVRICWMASLGPLQRPYWMHNRKIRGTGAMRLVMEVT